MNQKPIRVLFVINDFLTGGAQRLIADILTRIDREDFEPHLLTLFDFEGRPHMYQFLPEDVPLHRIGMKGGKDARGLFRLFAELRKMKPDVVVSNLFLSNALLRFMKPFFGYRIITVEHNTYSNKKRIEVLIDRFLSFLSYRVVAVSGSVATFTRQQQHLSHDKVVVIRNGVDVAAMIADSKKESKEAAKASIGVLPQEHVVLNVGRLTVQKNHQLLIGSFQRFLKSKPDHLFKLIILGEGSLRSELEKQIEESGLGGAVLLPGVVAPQAYYRAADFFISTSTIEGLSIAYAEALAYGLPIVATKTAGTDEMIEDAENGYFIESPESDSVVAALQKMLSSDLRTMSENARSSALQFSIQDTTRAYEALIKEARGRS